MPIYEYACERCGTFEQMQRITDPPIERCPTCRRKVHRLISSTSFQLKGSGWYVTDYARAGKANGGTAEGVEKKAESKGEPKGEAKPASTSESKTAAAPATASPSAKPAS